MRILCRRRFETISNLAEEFGVSSRTISRDIEVLSLSEPIYTICGKYGGVYVMDGYSMSRMYMTEKELSLLLKLSKFADEKGICDLSEDECKLLKSIISMYTKSN